MIVSIALPVYTRIFNKLEVLAELSIINMRSTTEVCEIALVIYCNVAIFKTAYKVKLIHIILEHLKGFLLRNFSSVYLLAFLADFLHFFFDDLASVLQAVARRKKRKRAVFKAVVIFAVHIGAENSGAAHRVGRLSGDEDVILLRKIGGKTAEGITEKLTYTDLDAIADWALEAVTYCTAEKYLAGSNGAFSPKGTATRAMGAKVLMNMTKEAA